MPTGNDVRLVTDDGTSVALDGDALAGVRSGDAFDGVLAVDRRVADELRDTSAPPTADVGALVAEKSAELDIALTVVTADIDPLTAAAVAPRAHTVDVMYLSASSSDRPAASAFSKPVSRLSEFWSTQSNGQVSKITRPSAVRFATVKKAIACDPGAAWAYASGRSGFNRTGPLSGDRSSYYWASTRRAHLVVVVPGALCGVGNGLGTVGSVTSGGTTWSSVPTSPTRWDGVVFHEIGHNLGLGHSNLQACPHPRVDAAVGSSTCQQQPYADYYDVMGGGFYAATGHSNDHHIAALNVTHKAALDALPRSASLRRVALSGGKQQTFTLQAASAASGVRGLEIVDPATNARLYVEYRSGGGRDADSFYTEYSAHQGDRDPMYAPGVRILKFPCTVGTSACESADSLILRNWTGPSSYRMSFAAGDDFVSYRTNSAGSSSVRVSVLSTGVSSARVLVSFDSRLPSLQAPSVEISGTPRYYRTLTAATTGAWTNGTTVRHQWLRDGVAIPGATASTYQVTADDADRLLTVRLIGTAPGHARRVVLSPARRASGAWDPVTVAGVVSFPAGASVFDRTGVRVVAYPEGEQPAMAGAPPSAAVNATTGAYTLTDLPPGRWRFAAMPGPGEWVGDVERQRDLGTGWHGGAAVREDATILRLAGDRTGVGIAMPRSLRISGTVRLPAGMPTSELARVRVRALGVGGDPWPRTADTVPAADGRYTIVGLDRGSYQVAFEPSPWESPLAPEFYDGARTSDEATTVTLTADRVGVDASLERLRRVSGRVTGVPQAAWMAYLTVEARDATGMTQRATVAENGTFAVDRLLPSAVTLCLLVDDSDWSTSPPGHLTTLVPSCLGGAREHARSEPLDLRAGDGTGLTFAAAPARAVSGRISLPAGLPSGAVGSVSVSAYPLTASGDVDTGVSPITGDVGSDGRYRVSQLTPGAYALQFAANDPWWDPDTGEPVETGLVPLWLGATAARTSAATVDVTGGSLTGRDITMVRGNGRLTGRIDLAALPGSPSWGYITIVDSAGRVVAQSTADATGFTQRGLVPGRYRVMLTTEVSTGTGTATAIQYLRTSTGTSLHTVAAGAETTVAFVATPATARLKGSVRAVGFSAPATTMLATAQLYVREGGEWVALPRTIAERHGNGVTAYTSPLLAPGTYTVRYSPTPDAVRATGEWWERKSASGSADTVVLGAGEVREGVHGTVRAPGYTATDPMVTASTPTITGTVRVGSALAVSTGAWTAGTTFTYRWTVNGATVSTAPTFTPRAADRAGTLAVSITGSAASHLSATRTSLGVTVAVGVLTSTVPKISGTPKVGRTLKVSAGSWTAGTALTYRWYVAGRAIAGATGKTFVPRSADRGKIVTAKVTGRKAGYTTVSRPSKPTAKVAAASKMTSTTPKISGTPAVGRTLSVVRGTWTTGVAFSYTWYASGRAITGAKSSKLVLTSAQRGKTITVKVTGRKAGFVTTSRTSKATTRVR